MSESLAQQLLHSDLEVACPACEYEVWVQYSEIVAQTAVLCPCCHVRIWLRDADGGIQKAGESIENQIQDVLKGLWT